MDRAAAPPDRPKGAELRPRALWPDTEIPPFFSKKKKKKDKFKNQE